MSAVRFCPWPPFLSLLLRYYKLFDFRDAEVFADLSGEDVIDFSVTGYRGAGIKVSVLPPGVIPSFSQQFTTVIA